ncbi:MAG: NADH-quinone oxidoreductase subunit A [Leptospirillia bacterium]
MTTDFVPTDYLPVLIFFVIAGAFGFVTIILGRFVRPQMTYREKLLPYECGAPPISDARQPFPMRYYIIAMLFVLFDIEAVFMYPWAVVFNQIGIYGLVEMVLFITILLIGYVYAWGKGALEWD